MPKYFIVVIPPVEISTEIIGLQKEIEVKFGSVHAQKAPPHITIIPPFDCELKKLEEFIKNITHFLSNKLTIDIKVILDNIQRFESRTLFVDVAKNEVFEKLCKELKLLFNQQKLIKQRIEKHYFAPHITLANKDIKKRDFKLLWEDFKTREYQRNFALDTITVLELNNGNWIIKSYLNVLP